MASASLPRRKSLSEQQALARLREMVAADSDGGEVSFAQQLTDASSEESEMETEEEPNMPPRKMRRGTGKPSPSQTAKDGTVWAEEDTGSVTARAGPTESAKRKITGVLQSFLCLLDVGMLQTITECTVRQARRTEPDWKLTIHELMAFISILFVRAIMCPVGAIVDCWSEMFLVPVIKETMPRDRFVSIMQHLRFDDKDTRAERVKTDRFAAISDIWTRFTKNCAESFTPGAHMTINEQLFPTKVRCPFTQYISSKLGKFGMKFWIATDLETKYVCNASPYLGKDPSHQEGEGLPENVVMSLVEPFLDDGRNVLTIYAQKKTVCLLSSLHRDVAIGGGRKRKPNTITDYNHMKCGVNVLNQMARMYSVRAATHRWPVAVFYNILDLAAMNAHILYKACTGSTEKRRVFMAHLAEELRRCFMQQKGIEKEMKMRLRQASVPQLAPGKKTQCQVLRHCNRNHSTERCVQCDRYTCRKCRKEGPWVCDDC